MIYVTERSVGKQAEIVTVKCLTIYANGAL